MSVAEYKVATITRHPNGDWQNIAAWTENGKVHHSEDAAVDAATKALEANTTLTEVVVITIVARAKVKRDVTVEHL